METILVICAVMVTVTVTVSQILGGIGDFGSFILELRKEQREANKRSENERNRRKW